MTQLIIQSGPEGQDASIISGSSQNTNFGNDFDMIAGLVNDKLQLTGRILMRFDLRSIPLGSLVTAASLQLTGSAAFTGSQQFTLRRLTRGPSTANGGWTELGCTWRHYDGVHLWTTAGGDFTTVGQTTVDLENTDGEMLLEFAALAPLAQDAIDQRGGWLDLIVIGPEAAEHQAYFSLHSSDAAEGEDVSACPRLAITYVRRTRATGFSGGMQELLGTLAG